MRKSIGKSVSYLIEKNIPEYKVAKLQVDVNSINGVLIKNEQNVLMPRKLQKNLSATITILNMRESHMIV